MSLKSAARVRISGDKCLEMFIQRFEKLKVYLVQQCEFNFRNILTLYQSIVTARVYCDKYSALHYMCESIIKFQTAIHVENSTIFILNLLSVFKRYIKKKFMKRVSQ